MELHIENKGTATVLFLSGSITGEHSIKLSKTLTNYHCSGFDEIILDLSKVEYIDSPGLGGIIYAQILLQKHNKKIVLSAPKNYVTSLFRDCKLDQKFEIVSPAG